MEENLEPSKEIYKDISEKTNKFNSEEIKKPESEKLLDLNENNNNSQNNSSPKLDKKK